MQWFQPATVVLQECIDSTPDLKVLLHLFSNGGSHSAVQLAEACEQGYPPFTLPITSIIFDSCPSMPKLNPLANSLALGFPSKIMAISMVTRVVAYGLVGLTLFLQKFGLVTHSSTKLYRVLNSANNVFLMRSVSAGEAHRCPIPRTYIYGPDDIMVTMDQVIQHADIAIANMLACGVDQASKFVTMEEFVGSPHVNHIKFEKERYWRVIKETWQRSVAKPMEMIRIDCLYLGTRTLFAPEARKTSLCARFVRGQVAVLDASCLFLSVIFVTDWLSIYPTIPVLTPRAKQFLRQATRARPCLNSNFEAKGFLND
jgi:hypothetical protein